MHTLPCLWADLVTNDFARLDPERTVALLPVAAVEQHGPHLPLSVDADIARGLLKRTLGILPVDTPLLVLPTQDVGYSPEHLGFAGTLSLRAETVLHLWTEIGECVARSGVRKLLIFNTHGGQVGALDLVARDLRARLGLLVVSSSWFNLPLTDEDGADLSAPIGAHEARFGVHGGAVETSMMLAMDAQRVRMDRAQSFASTSQQRALSLPVLGNGRSARLAWQTQDLNPAGAVGDASAATPELGERLLGAASRSLAALVREMVALPLSTLTDAPAPKASW